MSSPSMITSHTLHISLQKFLYTYIISSLSTIAHPSLFFLLTPKISQPYTCPFPFNMEEFTTVVLRQFALNFIIQRAHVAIPSTPATNLQQWFWFVLVGRTFIPTGRDRDGIMLAIRNWWQLFDSLEIILVNDELFFFNFKVKNKMISVFQRQPWCIYNQVLLLQNFITGVPPQDIPLQSFDIWFSFIDLPFHYWSYEEIVRLLHNVTYVAEI